VDGWITGSRLCVKHSVFWMVMFIFLSLVADIYFDVSVQLLNRFHLTKKILPGSDNLIKMINLFTDVSFHLSLPLPTLSLSLDVGVWWEVELGGGGGRCV